MSMPCTTSPGTYTHIARVGPVRRCQWSEAAHQVVVKRLRGLNVPRADEVCTLSSNHPLESLPHDSSVPLPTLW